MTRLRRRRASRRVVKREVHLCTGCIPMFGGVWQGLRLRSNSGHDLRATAMDYQKYAPTFAPYVCSYSSIHGRC